MTCNLPSSRSLVDAHFAGNIAPARERVLRTHLPGCDACREYYDRHLFVATLDPAAKKAQDRIGVGLGLAPAPKTSRAAPYALALCAAAALLFLIVPLRGRHEGDDFASRGSAATTLEPKLLAYRIERGQVPRTLGRAMKSSDELAFAYANPGSYERLMIFAVDEHRHIYWYHPEWTSQADDPHAIPINGGADVREIPAAVSHSFDGSELTLFAIFSNEDLTVRKVEQLVQRSKSIDDPLPLKNAVVQRVHLSVEP
jgi:hypothetical protein